MDELIRRVDHLVYATPDLDRGIERAEALLGVEAVPGGAHPGWGTRNALIGLGPGAYLEIVGPDPEQPEPEGGRPFRIDKLGKPVLVTWAVRVAGLAEIVIGAAQRGLDLGDVLEGERRRPDGSVLSWRLTNPFMERGDGIVPFFIDWGESPHPSEALEGGCELVGLRGKHTNPGRVRELLEHVEVELPVSPGGRPRLVAQIRTGKGVVELR